MEVTRVNLSDNITFEEKVALEGEISYLFYTSTSMEDTIYRAYLALKSTEEELRPFFIETIAKLAPFSNEVLQRILLEINLKSIPTWIWIDKTVRDLKDTLSFLSTSSEKVSSIACLDRSEAKKRIITSAFVYFGRQVALKDRKSAFDLCKRIRAEKELDFLTPACISLIDEIKCSNIKSTKKGREEAMCTLFDVREILSFKAEHKVREMLNNKTDKKDEDKTNREAVKIMYKTYNLKSSSKEEILKDIESSLEDFSRSYEVYAVKKIFKGSKIQSIIKVFPTLEEATKFIEDIKKNYPELLNTCSFEIVKQGM